MSDNELPEIEGGIEGPDSEEILSELLERFANRNIVLLHRAVISGNVSAAG